MQYSRRNGALMTLTVAESARHLSPKRVRVPGRAAVTATVAVIGGGMAGLEVAAALATRRGLEVEVFERGPQLRREHIDWDTTVYAGDEKTQRWSAKDWG